MKTILLRVRMTVCILLVLLLNIYASQAKTCTICITNSYGEQSLLTLNEYKPGSWTVTGTHDYSIWGGTIWPVNGSYSCITKKLHYVATNPNPDSCVLWANTVTFDYVVSDMDLTGSFTNDCGYNKGFTAVAVMGKCLQAPALMMNKGEYGCSGSHRINRSLLKLPKGENLNELLKDKLLKIAITPNPATQKAQLSFAIESAQKVQLNIYDNRGNLIYCLCDAQLAKGDHSFEWNLKSSKNIDVPRGYYYVRLVIGERVISSQLFVER